MLGTQKVGRLSRPFFFGVRRLAAAFPVNS
jgi:hypothetical protein